MHGRANSFSLRLEAFWRRVTDGLELHQLWAQFQADARASYHLYSRDVDFTKSQDERHGRHFWKLVMASFQASLKALCTTPAPLAELVNGMNRYACTNSQGGRRFTTAFLAEFAPARRTLTYINAGHNVPLLRRAAGSIERLETGGLPLGIQSDAKYQSATVTLQPGDWIIIFTDGLVEATNDRNEEYGEQRVIATLNAGCSSTPSQMISQIMVGLDIFVGNNLPLADDVTCMLVKADS